MKKYPLLISGLVLLLYFMSPQSALAHFPAKDKAITVVLHTDPDDNPIPGQQAKVFFDISDTTHRFSPTACSCNLTILESGKTLLQQKLSMQSAGETASLWTAEVPFVFPSQGVYHIALSGMPLAEKGTFQPFTVSWNFQVDQSPATATKDSLILAGKIFLYLAGGAIILFLLAFGGIKIADKLKS